MKWRQLRFWAVPFLVPVFIYLGTGVAQESAGTAPGSFLDGVLQSGDGVVDTQPSPEACPDGPTNQLPPPAHGKPILGMENETQGYPSASGTESASGTASASYNQPLQKSGFSQIAKAENWTQARRGVLPGDNVTPPSGSAAILAEMKSKFNITPRNGSGRWDESQLRSAFRVLSSLPESFRKCTRFIQRDGGQGGVLGWVMLGNPTVHIESAAVSPGTFQGTLVHEMVHCFQAQNDNIYRQFIRTFYPGGRRSGRSVSAYGCTSAIEDMAECGRAFWAKGALMKKYYPGRYEFMKRYVFGGTEFIDAASPTGGTPGPSANPPGGTSTTQGTSVQGGSSTAGGSSPPPEKPSPGSPPTVAGPANPTGGSTGTGGGSQTGTSGSSAPPPDSVKGSRTEFEVAVDNEMMRLINEARAKAGAGPVTLDPSLHKAAYQHALDMYKRRYCGHQTKGTEGRPAEDFGYQTFPEEASGYGVWAHHRARKCGFPAQRMTDVNENAAEVFDRPDSKALAAVCIWEYSQSEGHWANLLNKRWNCVGLATIYRQNDKDNIKNCQVFGYREK